MARKRLYELKKELLNELYFDAVRHSLGGKLSDNDLLRLGHLLGETDKQITRLIEYFQEPGDASQYPLPWKE